MSQIVKVQWTETAKECLRQLPRKVVKGFLDKATELSNSTDPQGLGKALTGPLQGYYRITYSRYRAIYRIDEDVLPNGDVLVVVRITFLVAGQRKDGDKRDVYQLAAKLIKMAEKEIGSEVEHIEEIDDK